MTRKKIIILLSIIFAVISNILVCKYVRISDIDKAQTSFNIELEGNKSIKLQFFHCNEYENFSEEASSKKFYSAAGESSCFSFPVDASNINFRMDFGDAASDIIISKISFSAYGIEQELPLRLLWDAETATHGIKSVDERNGKLYIETEADDPYVVFKGNADNLRERVLKQITKKSIAVNIVFCILIDALLILMNMHMGIFSEVPLEVMRNRKLVWSLAKNDFKTKYAGSYLGIIWAFVQPIVTIAVYWFVFQVGLKAGKTCDYPFILFLMSGLVPWFFMSDALTGGMNALIEYNYLVKKVVFKISILPFVKCVSAVFVHVFFVVLVGVICMAYGYPIDIFSIQILYYLICNMVLVLGLTYLTSAVVCFFRDLTQIVTIVLQVGMWITPIMWDAEATLSPMLIKIFKLNPMYYIVDGYRDALLAKTWFWEKMPWTICFWLSVLFLFGLGMAVFRKLRVHFADVL